MKLFTLVYIMFVIVILWIEKMIYKDSYEAQYNLVKKMWKLNNTILKNDLSVIEKDYEILKENSKLREENKNLTEKLKKCKENRVAKVIKEEKTDESI